MASNIEYRTFTVTDGSKTGINTLSKISGKEDINIKTLEKLNPNIKGINTMLEPGDEVLIGVGSMTDSYDGFAVGTLYVYRPKQDVNAYRGMFTDPKGVKTYVDIPATEHGDRRPDLSLNSLVEKTKGENGWYGRQLDEDTLLKLNPWVVNSQQKLLNDYTLLLEVCSPGTATKATILECGILVDTTRTCYVRWAWDHKANGTSGVEVRWRWQSSDGQWWTNKTDVTDTELFEHTYSPNEAAIRVEVCVKPISNEIKSTIDKVVGTQYEWTTAQYIDFSNDWVIVTPSAPSVEIRNYKLTATYEKLPVEAGSVTHVQFEVIRDDVAEPFNKEDRHIYYPVGVGGYIQYSCTVEAGYRYRVRARCCKALDENFNVVYHSSWSDLSNSSNTLPTAPTLKECKVISNKVVQFTWTKVNCADNYELQYLPKDDTYNKYNSPEEYFNNPNSTPTNIPVDAATAVETVDGNIVCKPNNVAYGEYLARVRSGNETTSKWSNILGFVIGELPDSPTTWSSTTTVVVGEPLRLYWIHNSKDGSEESRAEITLYLNDGNTRSTYTVERTKDNTLEKIATNNNIDLSKLLNMNPSLNINDTLEPGTQVRIPPKKSGSSYFMLVVSETENTTSHLEINTGSYPEGSKIDWQVRTAGALKGSNGETSYGSYSIDRTVDIYAPPTLNVNILNYNKEELSTDPFDNKTLTSLPFFVTLNAGNTANQKPTGYHVSVVARGSYNTVDEMGNDKSIIAGNKVFSKYYDVTDTSFTVELSAKDLTLVNNEEYEVVCTVSMSSGLMKESSSAPFRVAWLSQGFEPNAEIGIDKETLTALIRPFAIGAEDTVNLSVYRREFDGTFTEIATELENTESTWVTDPHPALDYARYRVISRDKGTGSINYFDVPAFPVGEHSVVIQWDEKWQSFDAVDSDAMMSNVDKAYNGSILKLPYNIDVSNSHSSDVSLVRYIGRKRPVSYYGTQLGETATWNVVIPKSDKETLYALRRLAIYMGNVYVREPSGSGYWASINISFSQKHIDVTIPVTINITPVEGGM